MRESQAQRHRAAYPGKCNRPREQCELEQLLTNILKTCVRDHNCGLRIHQTDWTRYGSNCSRNRCDDFSKAILACDPLHHGYAARYRTDLGAERARGSLGGREFGQSALPDLLQSRSTTAV